MNEKLNNILKLVEEGKVDSSNISALINNINPWVSLIIL